MILCAYVVDLSNIELTVQVCDATMFNRITNVCYQNFFYFYIILNTSLAFLIILHSFLFH